MVSFTQTIGTVFGRSQNNILCSYKNYLMFFNFKIMIKKYVPANIQ